MSDVLDQGELLDTSVVVEYQLPLTSRRLDCMVLGRDVRRRPNAVIVELKQWDQAHVSDVEGCVETWVGGRTREVLHPSVQVGQYRQYLADGHFAFSGINPIALAACSFLHNATLGDTAMLRDDRYAEFLEAAPVFSGDQAMDLVEHLRARTLEGDGGEILGRVTEENYRPSKGLMNHVAQVIEDNPVYTLLDEQMVAFQSILNRVRKGYHTKQKAVVLVHGGPGTGKSVVAANLVARLSKQHYSVCHATGSKAFTENLKKQVGSRAAAVFKYFNNFTHAEKDGLDVLVCDEAHRIRNTSNHRFIARDRRSERPQVEEFVRSARVSVFFLDDMQTVRPGEVGSSDLIRDEAHRQGADLDEYELEAQFRCAGSEGFVNWIDNTLGVRRTANVLWNQADEAFDFRIMPSVEALDQEIRELDANGQAARLVAGYCWPWSTELVDGARLEEDVVIGDWRRPWNARPELTRLPAGIPKSMFWATDPGGIDQVGCVYTAQGFEFDYVGVIWGPDLRYVPELGEWVGDPSASRDGIVKRAKTTFLENVKHTYRVLLSRGMKGCLVYFTDPDTRRFVESRMERALARATPPGLAKAADRPQAGLYDRLGKTGAAVMEAMAAIPGMRESAEDSGLMADLAVHLERDDYAGWRQDEGVRTDLLRSIARVLVGAGVSPGEANALASTFLLNLRG
ncbi:MAG: DUF2075 domain-containing protein [Longimicrobiales bacterium]